MTSVGSSAANSALYTRSTSEHLLVVVDFLQLDFDNLALRGGDGTAHKRCLDGQLAMTAIDEHQELDAAGTAMIEEGVEGGANGAAGVEHVVDEDDVAAVDVEAERAGDDDGADVAGGEVVAIEADVEDAGVDGVLLDAGDERAPGAAAMGTPRRLMPTRPMFSAPLFFSMI